MLPSSITGTRTSTVAIIATGDISELQECLRSVITAAPQAQVIVHELRSPTAEALAAQTSGVTFCLPNRLDEEIIPSPNPNASRRTSAHGFEEHEPVQAWNMPSPMASTALESVAATATRAALPASGAEAHDGRQGRDHQPHRPPRIWAALSSVIRGRLACQEDATAQLAAELVAFGDLLEAIPCTRDRRSDRALVEQRPHPRVDAALLYTMLVKSSPTHYIEIGSGPATYFASPSHRRSPTQGPISFRSMRQCRPTRPFSATKCGCPTFPIRWQSGLIGCSRAM